VYFEDVPEQSDQDALGRPGATPQPRDEVPMGAQGGPEEAGLSNAETERKLRDALRAKGFSLNKERRFGETGVDIEATKDGDKFHIEVIGYKKNAPQRSRDFFEAFFRAVSRLDQGAEHCVMALPGRFENGLRARVRQYRTAWTRIAEAFPELEIWLVGAEGEGYEVTEWGDWPRR
jgi:hypothetical protein